MDGAGTTHAKPAVMTWTVSSCAIAGIMLPLVAAACGTESGDSERPDSIDGPDASFFADGCSLDSDTSECRVARTILSCDLAGGGGAVCLSDNPDDTCEGATADASCEPVCDDREYGMVCG